MKTILIRNKCLLTASIAAALSFTPIHGATAATTQSRISAVGENPSPDAPSLRIAISAYKKHPTMENRSAVKAALARLDLNIAETREHMLRSNGSDRANAAAKLNDLKQYRLSQMRRCPRETELTLAPSRQEHPQDSGIALRAKDRALDIKDKVVTGAKNAGHEGVRITKKAAVKTEEGAEKVAEKVEEGGSKVKRTFEKGARKTGDAMEDATH